MRRRTVETLLAFIKKRKDVVKFFRRTWIPDETFFQTIVHHVVPREETSRQTLTFLMFTDYGMPVTFYNDHFDLLMSQDALFARKISPEAADLKARLGRLYAAKGVEFQISNEGRNLFAFLTGRGRIGRRFAMRFWETESTMGRDRELMIVVCKKWHIAKRLMERIRQMTSLPAVDYLFNEDEANLPDLGGIQTKLDKRNRHRRSLMRRVFDSVETDRLVICLDPAGLYLLDDFTADRSTTRIMEIDCVFTDADLVGHAKRVGLAGEHTSTETFDRLLPTIRNDMIHESDRINDAGFGLHYRLLETASASQNAEALAAFLTITHEQAREILGQETLFSD